MVYDMNIEIIIYGIFIILILLLLTIIVLLINFDKKYILYFYNYKIRYDEDIEKYRKIIRKQKIIILKKKLIILLLNIKEKLI